MTSPGSSTTQITPPSRRSSWQIRQRGSSARLKQTSQSRMRSLTSRMASASAPASSASVRRMWNASRWAVRCPIPGSLPSSVTSRWTGGASRPLPLLRAALRAVHRRAAGAGAAGPSRATGGAEASEPSAAAEAERVERGHRVEVAAAGALHGLGLEVDGLAQRLVDRGEHHVGKQLDVLGVDRGGLDVQRLEAQVARDDGLDHAAAGRRLDALLLERLLRLLLRGHHLLGLLEHLLDVGRLGHQLSVSSGMTSSASKSARRRASSSSSPRCSSAPPFSSSRVSNVSRGVTPVSWWKASASSVRLAASSALRRWKLLSAANATVTSRPSQATGRASARQAARSWLRSPSAWSTPGHSSWTSARSSSPTGAVGSATATATGGASCSGWASSC